MQQFSEGSEYQIHRLRKEQESPWPGHEAYSSPAGKCVKYHIQVLSLETEVKLKWHPVPALANSLCDESNLSIATFLLPLFVILTNEKKTQRMNTNPRTSHWLIYFYYRHQFGIFELLLQPSGPHFRNLRVVSFQPDRMRKQTIRKPSGNMECSP